jgi:predicted amidohydrolase
MSRPEFMLGMGQMRVEGGDVEGNLLRAEEMIGRAARAGCRMVVLPECLDVGWLDGSLVEHAEGIPGRRMERLGEAARWHGVFVVAGLTEREGERFYNAAVLLDREGRLLLRHRKINELRFGAPHDRYASGRTLGVVETEIGCVGVNICADNLRPSLALGHALARMGTEMILSPCAWAVPAEHDNVRTPYGDEWLDPYGELTREHGISVIGVSCVGPIRSGPWKGRRCIGCSLAMGPGGIVLGRGKYGQAAEELVVVKVPRRGG